MSIKDRCSTRLNTGKYRSNSSSGKPPSWDSKWSKLRPPKERESFCGARAAPLGRLCDAETLLEPRAPDQILPNLESPLQLGSTAKAGFSLERSCPMRSMAPV